MQAFFGPYGPSSALLGIYEEEFRSILKVGAKGIFQSIITEAKPRQQMTAASSANLITPGS